MYILIYFAGGPFGGPGAHKLCSMYALGTLKRHGLTGPLLWDSVLKKAKKEVSCQRLTRHLFEFAIQRMSGCSVRY